MKHENQREKKVRSKQIKNMVTDRLRSTERGRERRRGELYG